MVKNVKFMNKFVKSTLILVFLLVAVFGLVACNEDETEGKDTLVVGSPEITGDFMNGFGNSAYDAWVKDLTNGISTYATTQLGEIVLNETVVKTVTTDVEATTKDKTYTFVLHEDLFWSDGEKIKAHDFVFGILWSASVDWINVGASSSVADSLVGYDEYRNEDNPNYDPEWVLPEGETMPKPVPADHPTKARMPRKTSVGAKFEGVQLLGEYSFSVTIDGEELPYYYEQLYASVGPMPLHVLAPEGATILSDNKGATMAAKGFDLMADAAKIGGYRYAPTVTSGPYKFVSFVNQVITLARDENFKGNFEGKKPSIEKIVIKRVNQALDVDLVLSGEIDLVTGVIEGSKIQKAQASTTAKTQYYSRNGYGLLAMEAHFGPTMDYRVRQAIAYLTDRQYVTDVVLEGYGSIVYSEYGLAQWMYVQSEDWVDENINKYSFSVTEANRVLDTSDYKFEADGVTAFDKTKATANSGYFRYNAAKEPLEIRHFGTEDNTVTDSLQAKFELNMQLAGMKYDITIGDFDTLLSHYYYSYELDPAEKKFHIFNLATNFSVAYDPYYSWHSDWLGTWYNAHQLEDSVANPAAPLAAGEKTLDELTVALRTVEPGDTVNYLKLWKEYQLRINKLIPNVPLYSNQYFDVFNGKIKGLDTTPFWDWTAAIVDVTFEK